MAATFTQSEEGRAIGETLIKEHFQWINQWRVRVDFIFRDDEPKKNGAAIWAQARKVSGLSAFLAGESEKGFFVIEIVESVWETLSELQKTALIHHELLHLSYSIQPDTGKWSLCIVAHDLEEFREIVTRYGFWKDNVQAFSDVCVAKQRSLFEGLENVEVVDGLEVSISVDETPVVTRKRGGPPKQPTVAS